ncbi:MAG: hypothetical protein ABJA61_05595 [Caldimonas sp.]
MESVLARCNAEKSSLGAGCGTGVLTTMKIPTSSCHTFCWKARHSFDVPFFYLQHGAFRALHIASRWELALKRLRRRVFGTTLTGLIAEAWI